MSCAVQVSAPTVEGVPGVTMNMLTIARERGRAPWVELTSANLTYLSHVVAKQYAKGDVHKKRKRKREHDPIEAEAAAVEEEEEEGKEEDEEEAASEDEEEHEEEEEKGLVFL